MSADDEIAVVHYKGKWYVDRVGGFNYCSAVMHGKVFDNQEEAESYASQFSDSTEYGMNTYTPTTHQVNEALESCFRQSKNKFWSKELLESNARKLDLVAELKKHSIELRDNSFVSNQFIDGSSQYTLDQTVRIAVEMDFLFRCTIYRRYHSPNAKHLAWKDYKSKNPLGEKVPELLKEYFQSIKII
jgi:hypothetical protein